METMHDILHSISAPNEDVLATIIRVEGSAYRKEGTSMLFRKDGSKVGLLSAGCLESDLSCRVEEMSGTNDPQTVVYSLQAEDDLSWGQGSGCNGVISVLLEPINQPLHEHLTMLKSHLNLGNKVTLIKKLDKNLTVSSYLYMADDTTIFGSWTDEDLLIGKTLLKRYHHLTPKSGTIYSPELASHLYIHTFEPKPRLIIFGAGDDVIQLVNLAANTGYSVVVSDWRPALCNKEIFPKVDQIIVGFPEESLKQLTFKPSDSVVIISHNFQRDKEYLDSLLHHELTYLGVLGSRKRTERLLGGKEIPSRLKSPIGLSIGAEGPEEIAVSIVADLIQHRKRREVGLHEERRIDRHIPCCG
jgi:xanthine dehydrogenase accessory factor